jgi:hypothetical protein
MRVTLVSRAPVASWLRRAHDDRDLWERHGKMLDSSRDSHAFASTAVDRPRRFIAKAACRAASRRQCRRQQTQTSVYVALRESPCLGHVRQHARRRLCVNNDLEHGSAECRCLPDRGRATRALLLRERKLLRGAGVVVNMKKTLGLAIVKRKHLWVRAVGPGNHLRPCQSLASNKQTTVARRPLAARHRGRGLARA